MINNYRVVLAYLNRKARVPKVPERLLKEITEFAEPYLKDGKGKLPVKRKFQVKQADLAYGKLKEDPYIFLVRIVEYDEDFGATGTWDSYRRTLTIRTKGDASDAEHLISSTLRHELIHLLQFATVENIGQGLVHGFMGTDMGPDLETEWEDGDLDQGGNRSEDAKEYYQHGLEYKPLIDSNAIYFYNAFKHNYDLKGIFAKDEKGKNLLDKWIELSHFFQHLKGLGNLKKMVLKPDYTYGWDLSKIKQDSRPIRYQKAVKDFYTLVRKLFESYAGKGLGELPAEVSQTHQDVKSDLVLDDSVEIPKRRRKSIVRPDGVKEWRENGVLHRTNGPAVDGGYGNREWWEDGVRHRTAYPAVVKDGGSHREWWSLGRLHRDNGSPAIVRSDGTKEWWENGVRHRSGGRPAVVGRGRREWWVNGKRVK